MKEADTPTRPYLPTVFFCFVSVMLTERIVLGLGLNNIKFIYIIAFLTTLVSLALFIFAPKLRRVLVVIIICAFVSCILAVMNLNNQKHAANELSLNSINKFEFVAKGASSKGKTYWSATCKTYLEGRYLCDVKLSTNSKLERGQSVQCVGRFSDNKDDDYGISNRMAGICGTVNAVKIVDKKEASGTVSFLEHIKNFIISGIEPNRSDARALLAGMICGDKEALKDKKIDTLFSCVGLSHLVAVSGTHLAILSTIIAAFLSRLKMKGTMKSIVLMCATLVYVIMCGVPMSALRAWIMSVCALCSGFVGRREHAISGVCVAGIIFCLINPATSGDIGFLFSVTCVLSLCIFSPLITGTLIMFIPSPTSSAYHAFSKILGKEHGKKMLNGLIDKLHSLLRDGSAGIVCGCSVMPLCASIFGRISIVAPLSALCASWLVLPTMVCGVLASVLGHLPLLGSKIVDVLSLPAHVIPTVAKLISRIPAASIPLEIKEPYAGIILLSVLSAVYFIWKIPSKKSLLFVLGGVSILFVCCICTWRFFTPCRMVMLNVGQGDAILVQDGATSILFDTGPDDSVASELVKEHVFHLDAVVITHQHDDHTGGLASIAGCVSVDKIYVANGVKESLTKEMSDGAKLLNCSIEELDAGDVIESGNWKFNVVWPREKVDGSENSHSLCVLASNRSVQDFDLLLMGDAEKDQMENIIKDGVIKSARDSDIEVLKVGHHGSAISIDEQEAHDLNVCVAAISAGQGNKYGHPKEECLSVLKDENITTYCTKDVGTIDIRPSGSGVDVICG